MNWIYLTENQNNMGYKIAIIYAEDCCGRRFHFQVNRKTTWRISHPTL
jgi:hypothetical protein